MRKKKSFPNSSTFCFMREAIKCRSLIKLWIKHTSTRFGDGLDALTMTGFQSAAYQQPSLLVVASSFWLLSIFISAVTTPGG